MKMSWFRATALCAAFSLGSMAQAEEPARFHTGLRSAEGLLKDLEYLTVKLSKAELVGKQKAIFDKNIQPNIDIFLIGVNPQLPVGMSFLFTEETGQGTLLQIPVEILKGDFIELNLDPIGITAEKDRKDKTLYELSGDTFNGWMRAKGDHKYASIAKLKTDVTEGVVTPDVTLNALFAKGYDFVAYSLNSESEARVRSAAFKKLKENRVSALKKRTDETQEAFNLRKLMLEQQMDNIGQLFAETLLIEGGWSTDADKKRGLGQSHWTAMADTHFARWIKQLDAEKSHFASVQDNDNSVFTARALLPISDTTHAHLKELYQLSPTVLKQQFEAEAKLNPEEKSARSGAANAGLEALNKSLDQRVVDLFLEIAPTEGKYHSFVLGTRSVDNRAAIETLVGHLGKVRTGWSSKTNIETQGETQIHSFTVSKPPQAMLDFYGGDGTVYVAAGPEFVGFATGVGSLDVLKKLVEQATTGERKAYDAFVDIRFHARQSLEVTHAFLAEKDFDLLRLMPSQGMKSGSTEPKAGDDKEEQKKPAAGGAADKLSALKNFDWEQTAIDAMPVTDDLVTIQMKLVNGALDSEVTASEGVMAGVGAVIAKFAKENFGGGN